MASAAERKYGCEKEAPPRRLAGSRAGSRRKKRLRKRMGSTHRVRKCLTVQTTAARMSDQTPILRSSAICWGVSAWPVKQNATTPISVSTTIAVQAMTVHCPGVVGLLGNGNMKTIIAPRGGRG